MDSVPLMSSLDPSLKHRGCAFFSTVSAMVLYHVRPPLCMIVGGSPKHGEQKYAFRIQTLPNQVFLEGYLNILTMLVQGKGRRMTHPKRGRRAVRRKALLKQDFCLSLTFVLNTDKNSSMCSLSSPEILAILDQSNVGYYFRIIKKAGKKKGVLKRPSNGKYPNRIG
ncbi:hypothetical protein BY458DRAFT_545628 [Sporodiniella umbellata]|nr:hypothetical protein BY458DRAFT_545628 [Sporodiniella umbellata]